MSSVPTKTRGSSPQEGTAQPCRPMPSLPTAQGVPCHRFLAHGSPGPFPRTGQGAQGRDPDPTRPDFSAHTPLQVSCWQLPLKHCTNLAFPGINEAQVGSNSPWTPGRPCWHLLTLIFQVQNQEVEAVPCFSWACHLKSQQHLKHTCPAAVRLQGRCGGGRGELQRTFFTPASGWPGDWPSWATWPGDTGRQQPRQALSPSGVSFSGPAGADRVGLSHGHLALCPRWPFL